MTLAIISREEASAAGLKRYYTGRPCRRGHVAESYTSSGGCAECQIEFCRARPPEQRRAERLRFTYGITPADFDAMLRQQDGRCKICRSDDPGDKRGWHVDHCHSKGHVRGLLCTHCNRGLGGAQDSIATLYAMIEYLRHSLQ